MSTPSLLQATSVSSATKTSPRLPRNAVAKIAIKSDARNDTTRFTIIPVNAGEGQEEALHSFTVSSSNLDRATEMLKPLLRNKMPMFRKLLLDRDRRRRLKRGEDSTSPAAPSMTMIRSGPGDVAKVVSSESVANNNAKDVVRIKDLVVDKTQSALKVKRLLKPLTCN